MKTEYEKIRLLLIESFSKGFDLAMLDVDKLGHIWKIILSQGNGVNLLFENNMIDLEERKEEGQLIVSEMQQVEESEYFKVNFPEPLGKGAKLYLLLSQDERNSQPSGLRILDENGVIHNIVVGAAPNTLVFLTPYYEEKKKPEYSLDHYEAYPL